MSLRKTRSRLVAVLAVALLAVTVLGVVVAGCGETTATTTAPPATETTAATTAPPATETTVAPLEGDLNGAGATFPLPLYVEWIGLFQETHTEVRINYQGVGSGAGIEQLTAQTVDFGASDAFMKDDERAAAEAARPGAKVLHIPTVFGSVVLAYNLPGIDGLKLDADAVAGIFLGTITKWDDPALTALNPGLALPAKDIHAVHRADSSGTTNAFTSYLTAVNEDWAAGPGAGKEVVWPSGIGARGNDGVAAVIEQTDGAIGYIELAFAVQNDLTTAELKNRAGNFVAPTPESVAAAADVPEIPADMNIMVADSPNPEAYPIVSVTYLLAYDKWPDAVQAEIFKAFVTWALTEGSPTAAGLGYAPLPDGLRDAALEIVATISGS